MQMFTSSLLLLLLSSLYAVSIQPQRGQQYIDTVIEHRQAVGFEQNVARIGGMVRRQDQSPWQ